MFSTALLIGYLYGGTVVLGWKLWPWKFLVIGLTVYTWPLSV